MKVAVIVLLLINTGILKKGFDEVHEHLKKIDRNLGEIVDKITEEDK